MVIVRDFVRSQRLESNRMNRKRQCSLSRFTTATTTNNQQKRQQQTTNRSEGRHLFLFYNNSNNKGKLLSYGMSHRISYLLAVSSRNNEQRWDARTSLSLGIHSFFRWANRSGGRLHRATSQLVECLDCTPDQMLQSDALQKTSALLLDQKTSALLLDRALASAAFFSQQHTAFFLQAQALHSMTFFFSDVLWVPLLCCSLSVMRLVLQ